MTSNKNDYKIGDTVLIVENDYPNYCAEIGQVISISPGGVQVMTPEFSDSLFHFHHQVEPIALTTLEKLIYGI